MHMFNNWTVGKRLIAGFGIATLTLLVIAIVSYRNTNTVIENDKWVAHTYQVRSELAELWAQVRGAETGQRGYLITGDERYLAPYQSAILVLGYSYGYFQHTDLIKIGAILTILEFVVLAVSVAFYWPLLGLG